MPAKDIDKILETMKRRTTLTAIRKRSSALRRRARAVITKNRNLARKYNATTSATIELMRYVLLQLSRLHNFAHASNDILALFARGSIECLLWCEMLASDESAGERYFDNFFIEEREILEASPHHIRNDSIDWQASSDDLKPFKGAGIDPRQLIIGLERFILDAGVGKRERLSKQGQDALMRQVFRVCSKFIHPSPWLLNNLEQALANEADRCVFIDAAIVYFEQSIEHFEKI